MAYVDGFLLTVPKKKLNAYKRMAQRASKIWKKHGALEYKECVADDMKPQGVTFTFPMAAKAKKDELVIFSYVVFKNRAHRDRANKKIMSDPAMNDPKDKGKPLPFDMKRLAYGGFKVLIDA